MRHCADSGSSHRASIASRPLLLLAAGVFFSCSASGQGNNRGGASVISPLAPMQSGATSGPGNRALPNGVPNLAPGGSPALLGGSHLESGPRNTQTTRSGYLGGRSTESDNPDLPDDPALPDQPSLATLTSHQFGACPNSVKSSASARIETGKNGDARIVFVASYLNQGRPALATSTSHYLLANLQEELQKPRPNVTLAGTYLGIASTMPVTPALVSQLGAVLCTPVEQSIVKTVSQVAESQRRNLLKDARASPN